MNFFTVLQVGKSQNVLSIGSYAYRKESFDLSILDGKTFTIDVRKDTHGRLKVDYKREIDTNNSLYIIDRKNSSALRIQNNNIHRTGAIYFTDTPFFSDILACSIDCLRVDLESGESCPTGLNLALLALERAMRAQYTTETETDISRVSTQDLFQEFCNRTETIITKDLDGSVYLCDEVEINYINGIWRAPKDSKRDIEQIYLGKNLIPGKAWESIIRRKTEAQ